MSELLCFVYSMGKFGEDQSTVKKIRRPSKVEDVWDCCVNFATLALRVWHCSVPCFMPNETVH